MNLRWPVLLAWITIAIDGYDVVVLGSILPTLSKDWGLDGNAGGLISTAGLVGITIGSVTIGAASDRWGRRPVLIACVAWFSVLTVLCSFAPGLLALCVLRFLAGLGLGGCFPAALAVAAEYARSGAGSASVTRIVTAYHVGAVLTALLAIPIVEDHGWRPMFAIGGVLGLVIVPLLIARLPESVAYLTANHREREATALAERYGMDIARERASGESTTPIGTMLKGRYLRPSLAFWASSFMGLLLVYGLNTWLPTIMAKAGYPLSASLAMLLTLNVGAAAGLLVSGALADRAGIRTITIGWFVAGALFLAVLSIKLPLIGVYGIVFLAGVFVFSSQVLVYAFVSHVYPPEIRTTALGFAAGVGRGGAIAGPIVVGVLVTAGLEYPGGFYFFALVSLIGALAISVVPAARSVREKVPVS